MPCSRLPDQDVEAFATMGRQDSDWDPLPDERLADLPGEETVRQATLRRASAAAAATADYQGGPVDRDAGVQGPSPALTAVPRQPHELPLMPPDNQLARIMQAEPSAPAATPRPAELRTVVRAPEPAPTLPPEHSHPRADEPWFKALPRDEQQRLHRAYAAEQGESGGMDAKNREILERFWVAYVVFFLSALPLMLVGGLDVFARMAMAGCTTGIIWNVVPHTRSWCSMTALTAYLGIVIAPNLMHLIQVPFEGSMALGGAVLVCWFGGMAAYQDRRALAIAAE